MDENGQSWLAVMRHRIDASGTGNGNGARAAVLRGGLEIGQLVGVGAVRSSEQKGSHIRGTP